MSSTSPNQMLEPGLSFPDSGVLPRISGANTVMRPNSLEPELTDDSFPKSNLHSKMIKQTPLPYQIQEFKPCTTLKKFEPAVRVPDGFNSATAAEGEAVNELTKRKRFVIVHTDRYSRVRGRKPISSTQQDRLHQEGRLVEDARSRMRLREALAHRARHDLHLGGDAALPPPALAGSEQQQQRRRLRPLRHRRLQGGSESELHESWRSHLGDLAAGSGSQSSESPRRRGHLVAHSSAHSLPALQLSHRSMASFATHAELDAISALLGDEAQVDPAAAGLDKVKLDGSKVQFNRRSDIMAELSRLKAMVLPEFARDLFVGRGIRLPNAHAVHKPRQKLTSSDPVLEALREVNEMKEKRTDSSGNVLVSDSHDQSRMVFAAKVQQDEDISSQKQTTEDDEEGKGEREQEREKASEKIDPFYALPDEDDGKIDESSEQEGTSELTSGCRKFLSELRAATNHNRAEALTQQVANRIRRLLAASSQLIGCLEDESQAEMAFDWLLRGLELFHDIDRECRGSISRQAFNDVVASIRGSPLSESESQLIGECLLLNSDVVSLLEFISSAPFLTKLLLQQNTD